MVKGSFVLLRDAGVAKKLAEILVCPLSKQPLRVCQKTNSLVSDALGVSYPVNNVDVHFMVHKHQDIVDGIPCLVPKDGKLLDADNETEENKEANTATKASDNF